MLILARHYSYASPYAAMRSWTFLVCCDCTSLWCSECSWFVSATPAHCSSQSDLPIWNKPPAGRSGIRWVGITGSEPILVVVGGSRRHLLFIDLYNLRIERFLTRKFGGSLWAICYGYLYGLMPSPRFSNPLPRYILVIAETWSGLPGSLCPPAHHERSSPVRHPFSTSV